jgi:sortase A
MTVSNNTLPLPGDGREPIENKNDPAVNLIRQKLARIYSDEPAFLDEEQEVEKAKKLSKHQKYVESLMNSGKSIVEVQTAWHEYYQGLSDAEKQEVWQEFYANNQQTSKYFNASKYPQAETMPRKDVTRPKTEKVIASFVSPQAVPKKGTTAKIRHRLLNNVRGAGQHKTKHHGLKSLLFGLSMGVLAIVVVMFSFFNERFIAPFITPSKAMGNSPVIIDPTLGNKVGAEPLVIIPKINVEVPVVYDVNSIDPKAMSDGLLRGVLHYPMSPAPGQNGNVVVVGHSSNNIFNKGQYKFAFVLLSRLEIGDIFMLNYNGTRYTYKIYSKKIVKPTEVSVLGPAERSATATLITCDPPGTAMNRLVVLGEQISPDAESNVASAISTSNDGPAIVPGNSESLFHRLFGWIYD